MDPRAASVFAEGDGSETGTEPAEPWYEKIEAEWGGHFRLRGFVSWPDDESFFRPVGTDTYYDAAAEFRLKNKLFLGEWGYFETHYEAVLSGGDTREKLNELEELFPALFPEGLMPGEPIDDDRRLLDLTTTFTDGDSHVGYHRLDRLSVTLLPEWGTVRVGRQAITWGNGLLFNPMDLFNPFSPTDIERDYKVGDDMVSTQFTVDRIGGFQFLYVPRRDPVDHDVEWDESSLAGKLHFARGTTEFDLMGARHFEDYVVGLGSAGYLGNTAWRVDATWTFLENGQDQDGYLSLVANMDYSWVWWQKNFYGFIEFYFNGLGEDDPEDAFTDPDIIERFARGELFTLGRAFLSGHVRIELHPLFNFYLTVINNLEDPSGIIQPRAIWDVTEDVQLTIGANVSYGEEGTEFGGVELPGTELLAKTPDSAFIWITYFF
ncbi:MAG: hypothetical protein JSV16_15745 [Candidatus Hydrogenedentota bacterium]|nr:MAG: hypothetical protein JSV16_15745 [Candidatus Hydrogenedentota bacterium]